MKFIAIAIVLASVGAASAQTLEERITRLESTNAAVIGRIDNIDAKVQAVSDKLDALIKATAPGVFQPSTVDAWGRGNPASFGTVVTVDQPMMMYSSGYLSMGSGSGKLFPRLRGILGGICKKGGRGG